MIDTVTAVDDGRRYDSLTIALHWATAALVFTNFLLAQLWERVSKPTGEAMENLHMSFGVLLTAVLIIRLIWRFAGARQLPSLDAGWMRLVAKGTHYLLYILLVVEVGLAWTFRWGGGRPMAFFGAGIPPLIGEIAKPLRRQLHDIHGTIGWAIVIIAVLHAGAALYHHYGLKDRVLQRMLPAAAKG